MKKRAGSSIDSAAKAVTVCASSQTKRRAGWLRLDRAPQKLPTQINQTVRLCRSTVRKGSAFPDRAFCYRRGYASTHSEGEPPNNSERTRTVRQASPHWAAAEPLPNHQDNFPETLVRFNPLVRRAHIFHFEDFVDDRAHRAAGEQRHDLLRK